MMLEFRDNKNISNPKNQLCDLVCMDSGSCGYRGIVGVLNIYIKYRVAVEREGEKECAAIFKIHFLPSY